MAPAEVNGLAAGVCGCWLLTSSGEVTNKAVLLVAACVARVCAASSGSSSCTAGEGGVPGVAGVATDCVE